MFNEAGNLLGYSEQDLDRSLSSVVDVQPENIVGAVEGSVLGLQHEDLRVGVRGIFVALQSA